MKIETFSGEVVLWDKARHVRLEPMPDGDGTKLTIHNISAAEAMKLLGSESTVTEAVVRVAATGSATAAPAPEAKPEPAAEPVKRKRGRPRKVQPEPEQVEPEPEQVEPEPEQVEPEPEQVEPEPEQVEPEPTNGVSLEAVKSMTKMRDLLVYMYEAGLTSPDAIVAECLRVKDEVPMLARVANLEDRVRRAFTVLALGED